MNQTKVRPPICSVCPLNWWGFDLSFLFFFLLSSFFIHLLLIVATSFSLLLALTLIFPQIFALGPVDAKLWILCFIYELNHYKPPKFIVLPSTQIVLN